VFDKDQQRVTHAAITENILQRFWSITKAELDQVVQKKKRRAGKQSTALSADRQTQRWLEFKSWR
jgi:hypothetical protein